MLYYFWLMNFLWVKLVVKMNWKTMMKHNMLHCKKTKLCRTLHSFGMFTLIKFWGCGFCMKFRLPNFCQRSFPALILLDREGYLSVTSLCHNCLSETFLLSQLFLWNILVKYVLQICCFWETNILWLCILPLLKTRCIRPMELPCGSCWGVPK